MRKALILLTCLLSACATAPQPGPGEADRLTAREREARLLLEVERRKSQERSELERLMREARKGGRELLERQERQARARSIEIYDSLLDRYPDIRSGYMAEASFRLAELLFEEERDRVRQIMESSGDTASVTPDFGRAIAAYKKVVERFPDHPLAEDALYGIAYCYTEQGDPDRAAEGYARLIRSYPETRYAVEISMRLGEYYFTMEDLPRAIERYQYVVRNGDPEYAEKALYKMGWSYYNLERYDEAIDSFFAVLDLNSRGSHESGNLARESIEIIARSYSESGGTPALVRRIRSRPPDSPYASRILKVLANLYMERSFFPEAVGTFRTYIQFFPEGPELPQVLEDLRETHHIRGDDQAALELSEMFLVHIGPGTEWYAQASREGRERARTLILESLETAANRRRARSQAAGGETELALALRDLDVYGEIAGEGTPCRIVFLRGTVLAGLERFPETVLTLNGLTGDGRCPQWAERAALVSADFQIGTYDETGEVDLDLFEDTVSRLMEIAPENPATPRAILALGEITLNAGQYGAARGHFSTLIRQYPASVVAGRARLLIARTFFREADYRQAAAWFREAWRKADDAGVGGEARRLHIYSLFKYAEELSAQGRTGDAAERFEGIYRQFPESDVAQVSLYNAGKLYRSMGLERRATGLFETLAATYSDSEFASEALQMSVLILEALGDPIRAGDDSMALAGRSQGEERAAALLKAAQLYSAGDSPGGAASARSAYIGEFPEPVDELSRQIYLLGHDLETMGNWEEARSAYERNIELQEQHPDRQALTVFAARGRLRIAERSFEVYNAYHIVPPVDLTVVRKRDMLQEVIRHFVAAGRYRTSDVITASNYYIGRALEIFKDDILSSPRPAGLTAVEREEYDLQLQEMAFPFEERALEAYRVNIQRSVELEILDDWIGKTYQRMAQLAPWAYRRSETLAYPSTLVPPDPVALPSSTRSPSGADAAGPGDGEEAL